MLKKIMILTLFVKILWSFPAYANNEGPIDQAISFVEEIKEMFWNSDEDTVPTHGPSYAKMSDSELNKIVRRNDREYNDDRDFHETNLRMRGNGVIYYNDPTSFWNGKHLSDMSTDEQKRYAIELTNQKYSCPPPEGEEPAIQQSQPSE